ncbi:unnamed protein product [Ectocarpus sp. 12 AP-2014]
MGHPKPPTPDATTYGAAITACSRGKQWQMALRFLEDMEKKVRTDSLPFSREERVSCWLKAGEWARWCWPKVLQRRRRYRRFLVRV